MLGRGQEQVNADGRLPFVRDFSQMYTAEPRRCGCPSCSGGAVANDAQCETLIRLGVESCERYYPAVQYVCWAGKTASAALESSLLETMGEA